MKDFTRSKKIAYTAVMMSLVIVVTTFTSIPIAGGAGYLNLGDVLIFIFATIFPGIHVAFAAGVGSMLADVIASYYLFAPFTLVIKFLMPLVVGLIVKQANKRENKLLSCVIASLGYLMGTLIMIAGYFIAALVLNKGELGIASVETAWNSLQGGVAFFVGVVCYALYSTHIKKYFAAENEKPVMAEETKKENITT